MKNLSNSQLVSYLVELASHERQLLGEVLRHLREVEDRGLHLELAYSSLYEFCLKELGYSEWESHVRIQAMRLTKAVPGIEQRLEKGEITLTVVAKAQSCFRRAEKKKEPVTDRRKKEIVEALCGSSTRNAERKLAEIFPDAPPREGVRMLSEGKVKIEFVVGPELWETMQELFSVRTHSNPEKRWDLLLGDMAKLAWKKWHPLSGVKESPWAPHVELR